MKNRITCKPMTALAVMVLCSQIGPVLRAQNSNSAPASAGATIPASPSETRPVKLSSDVAEILKLGRAHVSDEIIIAFIRNSHATYLLNASELLYLRQQGVSDPVLTAMLNARQNVAATAAQAAPTAGSANSSPQPVPVPAQPAPAYDASVYAQPSPTYVYPAPSYYDYYDYYGYWPYYWGYPAWSFGFGYYGGGYYGGRYGGYRGGAYGGGFHGGGGGFHGGGGGHR
jgi:uncharacterized membrane protein YgcG